MNPVLEVIVIAVVFFPLMDIHLWQGSLWPADIGGVL